MLRYMIAGLLVIGFRPAAAQESVAQSAPGQRTERRISPQRIEERLAGERPHPLPITPTTPVADATAEPTRWPEGFLLAGRRGTLRQAGEGFLFVFEPDDDGRRDEPVGVLPNSKLRQMASYAASGRPVKFAVTGRVTEYRGRNYVLVHEVAILVDRPPPAVAGNEDAEPDSGGPAELDILDQLQRQTPRAAPLEPAPDTLPSADVPEQRIALPAAIPTAELGKLWPEGARLDRRVGRLLHEDGWWTLAFESESTQPGDPPVRLLPNLALQGMEAYTASGLRDPLFVISGDVTRYGGRNYLLVRLFVIRRDDGNLK